MELMQCIIINKSGGLIFQRSFKGNATSQKLSSNDYLVIASTFHSVYALSALISRTQPCSGIQTFEGNHIVWSCYQTPTGVKIIIQTAKVNGDREVLMRLIYQLYADYVMKNPFYSLEMPIRCSKFNRALDEIFA